ncbi:molybdate ABC transporter substrate-binding protein [Skermanella pratensis]|uniref:molybdate ABC transporter substrate-binding protein n=1 Tax=Skermanella pratensis TaxID=2233999 RepID=UPI0013015CAC|nr:molybdate ABC transporter substrate-binding protein [Skermanella pratensis]
MKISAAFPKRRSLLAATLAVALAAFGAVTAPAAHARNTLVMAAASMKDSLEEVAKLYERKTGNKVGLSFAASSALAKQIEQQAPADIFISADLDWMDYLARRDLIKPESRASLLGNRLVLIAPKAVASPITIGKGDFPILQRLGESRLATGEPNSVPVGRYAKAALTHLGVWDKVEPRLVRAESVRSALAFVSRGEALFGIVYETDAKVDKGVEIVGIFPADSYPAIIYPAALTTAGKAPDAAAFLAFLKSPDAFDVFRKYGFTPAPATQG